MTQEEIIKGALAELEAMPVPRPYEVACAMTWLQQTPSVNHSPGPAKENL